MSIKFNPNTSDSNVKCRRCIPQLWLRFYFIDSSAYFSLLLITIRPNVNIISCIIDIFYWWADFMIEKNDHVKNEYYMIW